MLPVFYIAFVVLSCVTLAIIDMRKRTKDVCKLVNNDNKPVSKNVIVFGLRSGDLVEVDEKDVEIFKKAHGGDYEDFYLDAENVTIA
jgi:hypothetical protein